jgi:hypothetical protein
MECVCARVRACTHAHVLTHKQEQTDFWVGHTPIFRLTLHNEKCYMHMHKHGVSGDVHFALLFLFLFCYDVTVSFQIDSCEWTCLVDRRQWVLSGGGTGAVDRDFHSQSTFGELRWQVVEMSYFLKPYLCVIVSVECDCNAMTLNVLTSTVHFNFTLTPSSGVFYTVDCVT